METIITVAVTAVLIAVGVWVYYGRGFKRRNKDDS